jgi:hypothetical protein
MFRPACSITAKVYRRREQTALDVFVEGGIGLACAGANFWPAKELDGH